MIYGLRRPIRDRDGDHCTLMSDLACAQCSCTCTALAFECTRAPNNLADLPHMSLACGWPRTHIHRFTPLARPHSIGTHTIRQDQPRCSRYPIQARSEEQTLIAGTVIHHTLPARAFTSIMFLPHRPPIACRCMIILTAPPSASPRAAVGTGPPAVVGPAAAE